MRLDSRFRRLVAIAVVVAMSGGIAPAETAVTLDSFTSSNNLDYMVGYTFTTANPITVTDLGKFDVEGDGLSGAAQVGIWDLSERLLWP